MSEQPNSIQILENVSTIFAVNPFLYHYEFSFETLKRMQKDLHYKDKRHKRACKTMQTQANSPLNAENYE